MKIAIATDNGQVCAHFGRAPQFTFVTIENNEVIEKEVLSNPGHTVGSIPEFVNKNNASCMIAGGMGMRAVQFFKQYGIDVIMGVQGSINEVIKKVIDGTLKGGESLCSPGGGKGFGVEKIHTDADDEHPHHH
ncbi:MAG: Dinitrogenase iron-molybdenum cofactor [Promethearchaeota archaeon]|nr:MAG: Dinitrogenase iron-molybdenum cofactor [Candidatus Lokiarchaeota archaeon]